MLNVTEGCMFCSSLFLFLPLVSYTFSYLGGCRQGGRKESRAKTFLVQQNSSQMASCFPGLMLSKLPASFSPGHCCGVLPSSGAHQAAVPSRGARLFSRPAAAPALAASAPRQVVLPAGTTPVGRSLLKIMTPHRGL